MATTTNYGWTTPDDTALVKDGAAAIRSLGTSVDTTTKNLNPSTTLGDIEYRSSTANTNTRLGIGSTGQVLTVSGGVPAWAAVPNEVASQTGNSGKYLTTDGTNTSWGTILPSGATFISRTSFSASAAVTLDNLFSSTYENYLISAQVYGSSAGAQVRMQGRYGSTTHTGANYQNIFFGLNYNSSSLIAMRASSQTYWNLGEIFTASNSYSTYNLTFYRPNASSWLTATGNIYDQNDGDAYSGAASIQNNQTWGGLYLFPSTGTITGQISIYGLAAA
jgi:hypothetical protein